MKKAFFDFNIHAYPESSTPIYQFIEVAKRYGYTGIAITNHSNHQNITEGDMDKGIGIGIDAGSKIDDLGDFKVFLGVEIISDVSGLKDTIRRYRKKVNVLCVHGGDERINRIACEDPRVDVLSHPECPDKCGLNHVLARSAAKNNVAIGFDLGSIIQRRSGSRSRMLSSMGKNLELVRKYNVAAVITSNAHSIYELHASRDMMALAGLFGMTKEEAFSGLSTTPRAIIERNKKNIIIDGVEEFQND